MPRDNSTSLVQIPQPKPKIKDRIKTRVAATGRAVQGAAKNLYNFAKTLTSNDIFTTAKKLNIKKEYLRAMDKVYKVFGTFFTASVVGCALLGKKLEEEIYRLTPVYKKKLQSLKDIANIKKELILTRRKINSLLSQSNKMKQSGQFKNSTAIDKEIEELRQYAKTLDMSLKGFEKYAEVHQKEHFDGMNGIIISEEIKRGYYAYSPSGKLVRFTNKDNYNKAVKSGHKRASAQHIKSTAKAGAAAGAKHGAQLGAMIGGGLTRTKGGTIGGGVGGALAGGAAGAIVGGGLGIAQIAGLRAASPMARAATNFFLNKRESQKNKKQPNKKIRSN